jgi:hypothetical protein
MLLVFFKGFFTGATYTLLFRLIKASLEDYFPILIVGLLLTSCSPESIEELIPPCPSGDCQASFELDYPKDGNGYYHINLSWDGQHYPRFSIDVYAEATDEYHWYNNTPVVQANFYTDTTWQFQNDVLPIVQPERIYLSTTKSKKELYGKRIVGPFPPEMKGDTIEIRPYVFWDAGINYVEKEFSIKFIVE